MVTQVKATKQAVDTSRRKVGQKMIETLAWTAEPTAIFGAEGAKEVTVEQSVSEKEVKPS